MGSKLGREASALKRRRGHCERGGGGGGGEGVLRAAMVRAPEAI